ncbi:MAG: cobalamin-dependent protein [Minisyncoccia bacterium]|jgi:radical SAM superfamily enzyme YgiQ (UPF0313 family)
MKTKGLDVVMIAPGDNVEIYQELGNRQSACENPIWAGLLATFLRKKNISSSIIDAYVERLDPKEVASRVADINPELVAIVCYGHNPSASTQVMPSAGRIARAIKEADPNLKIIMIGGHVAALPEKTLNEECVDFVCTGEGPYTLLDLTEAIKVRETDYRKVRGLIYKSDDELVTTSPAPLVKNLNEEMNGIAWDLLPMNLYRTNLWHSYGDLIRQPYASIYTTLGCPYHCSFCCIQAPFKSGEGAMGIKSEVNSYRFWNPKLVVDQIGFLVEKFGIKNIKFADEMFVLNMKHVNGICDLIIERGYDLNIWAYTRVDTISGDEIIEKLRRAGFRWLCFGIEAASERVRNDARKGEFKDSDVFSVIKQVRDGGIYVAANYIFGLPEDDYDSMQQTLSQAMELNCEYSNFYSAMAYPGSQLYNLAVKEGWPLPKSWDGYSQHSENTLPLPTRYLTGQQVLQFRDWAWKTCFTNPAHLEMIRRKFGEPTVDKIKEESAISLKRNHLAK